MNKLGIFVAVGFLTLIACSNKKSHNDEVYAEILAGEQKNHANLKSGDESKPSGAMVLIYQYSGDTIGPILTAYNAQGVQIQNNQSGWVVLFGSDATSADQQWIGSFTDVKTMSEVLKSNKNEVKCAYYITDKTPMVKTSDGTLTPDPSKANCDAIVSITEAPITSAEHP